MQPIAITGIGCRLPGESDGPDAFWRNLRAGRDLIGETPADRWNLKAYHASDPAAPGRTYARWGGFVARPDEFDAGFFGISPREALRMDPQQRWLLETTWEALEDAGYPPAHLAGANVGVYIGISGSDYGDVQKRSRYDVDAYTNSGSALSIAANRISCLFDFRGPSLAVDTACSSSLVALDLACRAIWHGDIAIAVVGGANALFTPDLTIGFSKALMLSPDGRCKSFDAAANGYVRAEGAACVVLRPLDEALAAGDRIYAVIRSTFVNQDGRTASMTVPSLDQQIELLRQAYRLAEVQPEQVGYVEAHGTGTPVGDPIEANALGQVLGSRRGGRPLWIGSVKSNLGHLEPASGITGLVKLALALHHRMIPPSLHFQTANPEIAFDELGLKVATAPMSWEAAPGATALYGGVNSFGFGGTNAHAVLSSAPTCLDGAASTPLLPCCLWSVSARTADALREAALRDAAFLRASTERFADLAATAHRRRSHHPPVRVRT